MTVLITPWSQDYTQNQAIQELQEGFLSGLTLEDNFTATTNQSGVGLDAPQTVLYGTNKISTSGILDYNSGVFTALKAGSVAFKTRIRVGRTGSSGISSLFFWVEASVNGGSTWNVSGNSVDIKLENADDTKMFFDFAFLNMPAGLKFRSRFARSGLGHNSGDLIAVTPSATLITAGVPVAPSAQLTVYKLTNFNYV